MEKKMRGRGFLPVLLLVLAFTVSLLPGTGAQAASKSKALKAYKAFLAQSTIPWGRDTYYTAVPTKNCSFALAYIDNNSVPELVVSNAQDITHVAGWGVVFTYKNGKVQPVDNIQLDGDFYYYKKKGIFASSYLGSGELSYTYSKMSGVKAAEKLLEGKNIISGKKSYYSLSADSRKQISKSKFNSALKKLVGSTKKTKVKLYKNTSTNRTKRLK